MVNRAKNLLGRVNAGRTVGAAAIIMSMSYLLSRLLGLFRDRLLVSHFGIGPELSAYNAAFRLPEILFTLLVSGAFAVAFIPILAEKLDKGQQAEAWRMTSTLLNVLVLATLVGSLGIIFFADPLTTLMTPGFDASTHDLTVQLTRIMAITPMLFAISSVLGSIQQAFNRFVIFSLAGVLYNVGIIIGIVAFSAHWGIYGPAWGVILGVCLQALLQWLGLYGLGFKYRPVLSFRTSGVKQTLKLMIPRSIDQGIDQITYSVETIIGSTVSQAAIAQFSLANNLKNVPLVLIGSSITTAVFPRLAARAASGVREQLVEVYVKTARLILFLAIPSAIFAVVARGYIVRLLYGFGDTSTATTLGWFAGTIVFTSLFMLVSRMFYAMQDTKTPLFLSLLSIPINVGLSLVLAKQYGVEGLAMAASLTSATETLVLIMILRRRNTTGFGEEQIGAAALPMTVAGLIMAGAVYLTISRVLPLYAIDRGFITLMPKFLFILGVGILSYLVPCYFMRVAEAKSFVGRVKDIMAGSRNLT